jgi:hypothetical protein
LSPSEVKKYQPYMATWIFMELQAEQPGEDGAKVGMIGAMKTLKNINMTAKFGAAK